MAELKETVIVIIVSLLVLTNVAESSPIRRKISRRYRWIALPTTTYPTPTFPTTTYPTTTITHEPVMCHVDGRPYAPGEVIDSMYDMWKNHCSSTYCNHEGRVVHWENWNCLTTPTPFPTTTPMPTFTTTTRMTSTVQ